MLFSLFSNDHLPILHRCFVEGKMSCYAHDEHLDLEAQEVDSQVRSY